MDQTGSIKGIFAVIIFLSHIRQYSGIVFSADTIVIWVLNRIGQLMVTLFFSIQVLAFCDPMKKRENTAITFLKIEFLKHGFTLQQQLCYILSYR